MNMLTRRVLILDNALKLEVGSVATPDEESKRDLIKTAHNHLLEGLQKRTKNGEYIHDAPDWEPFPIARSFFTQRYP